MTVISALVHPDPVGAKVMFRAVLCPALKVVGSSTSDKVNSAALTLIAEMVVAVSPVFVRTISWVLDWLTVTKPNLILAGEATNRLAACSANDGTAETKARRTVTEAK